MQNPAPFKGVCALEREFLVLMRPDFLTSLLCTVEKSLLLRRHQVGLDAHRTLALSYCGSPQGLPVGGQGPRPVFAPVHVRFGVEPVRAAHEFVLFFLTPKLIGHTAPFLV